MKLVVGLGNPGRRYARSRHNVGFRVVQRFAEEHGIALDREEFEGRFGRGRVACADRRLEVGVLQPLTYMNLSGDAVAEAVATLAIEDPSRDLLVVSDDVDLPFGRLRLRAGGGSGGQRGLAHIIERLERRDFARLRFGIGRPGDRTDTSDYVLGGFSPQEEASLERHLARATEALGAVLCHGVQAAMNEFNREPAEEASER